MTFVACARECRWQTRHFALLCLQRLVTAVDEGVSLSLCDSGSDAGQGSRAQNAATGQAALPRAMDVDAAFAVASTLIRDAGIAEMHACCRHCGDACVLPLACVPLSVITQKIQWCGARDAVPQPLLLTLTFTFTTFTLPQHLLNHIF